LYFRIFLWKLLGENKLYKAQEAMATRVVATATVRAVKGRKLIPTRAALTLVRKTAIW